MKKQALFLLVLINGFLIHAMPYEKTKDDAPKKEILKVKNVIKFDLGQIGNLGGVGFSYERMIKEQLSVSFGIIGKYNTASVGGFGSNIGSQKTSGFGISPEIRYYAIPNYNAPRGLYLNAFYNYYNESYEEKYTNSNNDVRTGSVSASFNTFGATLGWMFRIQSSFVIDLGVGPIFQTIESPAFYTLKNSNGNVVQTNVSPNSSSSSLDGLFRFSLGWAF